MFFFQGTVIAAESHVKFHLLDPATGFEGAIAEVKRYEDLMIKSQGFELTRKPAYIAGPIPQEGRRHTLGVYG